MRLLVPIRSSLMLVVSGLMVAGALAAESDLEVAPPVAPRVEPAQVEALGKALAAYPHRIVHEKHVDGNWELFICDADGSNPVNLTKTPDVNEFYPHASPDGGKISFLVDEKKGDRVVRSVWWMNIDGTGRTLVAENADQPAWSPDSGTIAYMKGLEKPAPQYYANKDLSFYELSTEKHTVHPWSDPAKAPYNLLNLNYTPDGRWIVASVFGGMGYGQAVLAIEVNGPRMVKLFQQDKSSGARSYMGCRPDVSPDGKKISWALVDVSKVAWIEIADLDLTGEEPRVSNPRHLVTDFVPIELYHADWSPDSRYVSYSRGVRGNRMKPARPVIGVEAPTWDIWVADSENLEVTLQVTKDGQSNKEPDWVPARQ